MSAEQIICDSIQTVQTPYKRFDMTLLYNFYIGLKGWKNSINTCTVFQLSAKLHPGDKNTQSFLLHAGENGKVTLATE